MLKEKSTNEGKSLNKVIKFDEAKIKRSLSMIK